MGTTRIRTRTGKTETEKGYARTHAFVHRSKVNIFF